MVRVFLEQTPPTWKAPYQVDLKPENSSKKRKSHAVQNRIKSKLNFQSSKKLKSDIEVKEAAEALLQVSPEHRPVRTSPETLDNLKVSPLSFLCSVATQFSLGPGYESYAGKTSKGSLLQNSLKANANGFPTASAYGALVLNSQNLAYNTTGPKVFPSVLPDKFRNVYNEQGRIGIYSPRARRARLMKFLKKRQNRVWVKTVRYSCRKNLADGRVRVKGRFVSTKNKA